MRRLKLVLAYDGTRYAGWQIQNKPLCAGPPSIQNELERVLYRMLGTYTVVHGAGRTDAGVHAQAQVCHFDYPSTFNCEDWCYSLNKQLPADIKILQTYFVEPSFHARVSALYKTYAYALWMEKYKALPHLDRYCWSVPPLNLQAMQDAALHLVGRHDFAALQNAGSTVKSTTRTVLAVQCEPNQAVLMRCPGDWPLMTWLFTGDGFLKQMVRNMMGLLVWVGLGKVHPAQVSGFLAAAHRRAVPSPSAPARGLSLLNIVYPVDSTSCAI